MYLVRISFAVLIVTFFAGIYSCESRPQRKVGRGFYYWKTNVSLSPFEQRYMDSLGSQELFTRFFDVDLSANGKDIQPLAIVNFGENPPTQTIIPVVFITPRALNAMKWPTLSSYAEKIATLLAEKCREISLDPKEIQIDCDWTSTNKAFYFQLLKNLKQQAFFKNKKLSVTIRLHQVKYILAAGVPPADRGLLMVYNMDKLDDHLVDNSIISEETTASYLSNLATYPLPLDIALPIYSWTLLFRNNQLKGIIRNYSLEDFSNSTNLKMSDKKRYQVQLDTVFKGYALKKGDNLRFENSDFNVILSVANQLSKKLKSDSTTILLYHCDSINFSKYPAHELEKIFTSFR